MNFTNYVFLGCGNMGEPVLNAFLQSGVNPNHVTIIERTLERKEFFESKYRVNVRNEYNGIDVDVLVLAIKPQQLSEIDFSAFHFSQNSIIVSILAGTAIHTLQKTTGQKKIVRVMPNLPLLIGQGMTTMVYENIADNEKDFFQKIFSQAGKVTELKTEEDMHAATLIAGSGPAFYYAFCSAFQNIAEEYGFSENDAKMLAEQTLIGSAQFLQSQSHSTDELVKKVASKGGTTEAALKSFQENNLYTIIKTGIEKGVERSKQLANNK